MDAADLSLTMRLKYFGIRVTELQRSLDFYTRSLDLKEVGRGDMSKYGGGRGTWVLLEDSSSRQALELNWYPPGSVYAGAYVPGEGLDHIGFVVDDVAAAFRALVDAGAVPTKITPESTGGHVAYVLDPDGNWIEIFDE